jgi:hypothetical protein
MSPARDVEMIDLEYSEESDENDEAEGSRPRSYLAGYGLLFAC